MKKNLIYISPTQKLALYKMNPSYIGRGTGIRVDKAKKEIDKRTLNNLFKKNLIEEFEHKGHQYYKTNDRGHIAVWVNSNYVDLNLVELKSLYAARGKTI